ncbi:MAG: DNA/RNA non-specific endonuclease, partial [Pyrinomonadaceae bacterium]
TYDWVGTGWMIAEDVIVTNRHVAEIFAERRGQRFVISTNPEGKTVRAFLDFKEEHKQTASFETGVETVLFVEASGNGRPDLALLQLKKGRNYPPPIQLSTAKREAGEFVAAVGYPARDFRNDTQAMTKVFGDIYNVKRFSPGTVTSFGGDFIFTHDCSTLGGNSGSAIINIESGQAVGLHFGGQFQKANYAVKAAALLAALRRLKIKIPVAGPADGRRPARAPRRPDVEAPKPQDYFDREGYRTNFLGVGHKYLVSLPTLTNSAAANAAPVSTQPAGKFKNVLNYTHFSLVMNKERKMAFYTACNIDGTQLRRIPRSRDRWLKDPRVAAGVQTGEELYANNDLDRGHLVRRLDPVWGSEQEAKKANDDTFHFTNCSPQHADFNQRTWNELEDYLLDNAGVHDLKVSVFTGPVFRSDDKIYRSVRLPKRFWKIVAMVKEDGDRLSATAYMLSQADLLTDLEFVFGQFKTYQVSVSYVEQVTGLR